MIRHPSGLLSIALTAVLAAGCGDDPVIALPSKFVEIHAGLVHTCGMLDDGATFCWGGNELGQLGDGSRSIRTSPVPVLGGLRFTGLGLGGGHTCGVTSAGAAFCWGLNDNGQLGDGSLTDRATPGPVMGGVSLATISGGGAYSCGLTSGGEAHCWGWNLFGQLGDGSTTDRPTPAAAGAGFTFTSIATKAFHSCGLTAAGEVYCWGENQDAQLGNGGLDRSSTPVKVTTTVTFTSVDVGFQHTCGIATDAKLYCWGSNAFGQLGLGPEASGGSQTSPIEVPGDRLYSAVSTGAAFTCAIEQGTEVVYCWGFNGSGQLGGESPDVCSSESGSFPCGLSPQAVTGSVTFTSISAHTQHVCGLSPDRVAYCWGLGAQGQLGNGAEGRTVFSLEPVRVLGQP